MTKGLTTKPFWRVDAVPDHVPRRVLMLPGVGYSCDRPLLSWCASIAHDRGWWVQRAWWDVRPRSNNDAFVAAALDQLDHDAPRADQTLVIAKSMGSRAAPASSRRHWAGVWLTPLLTDSGVRQALLGYRGDCLLVGGDADRHWSLPLGRVHRTVTREGELVPSAASQSSGRHGTDTDDRSGGHPGGQSHEATSGRHRWVQVSGANHSLEIPGDWRASLAVQRTVFGLVDDFVALLSR